MISSQSLPAIASTLAGSLFASLQALGQQPVMPGGSAVLHSGTAISIGLIVILIGAVVWLTAQLTSYRKDIEYLKEAIKKLEGKE